MSQTVKFAPGQPIASVQIPISDDDIALESNITFTMAIISHGDVAVLSNATVTIVDNDHGELTIYAHNQLSVNNIFYLNCVRSYCIEQFLNTYSLTWHITYICMQS